MSRSAPKVSVVIPAYSPGEAVHRLVDSLDAQTLPQDEFEVVFVDDGSPDDTYAQLQGIAATRPNTRVLTIPNSGWPSRPRNVGTENARGEYVLFMDHDDSLYPDALRRGYDYARANDADVLNVMEYHTRQVWWMPSLPGNVPNAVREGGIERLMPFMPHKLYRRRMLQEHHIQFPERARALWEDWYINVGAWRHSKVVSVLADTPFYLRHMHGSNTSSTFDAKREDYWDRLEDVLAYVRTTLDGPQFRRDRSIAMARHIILRVIDPIGRMVDKAEPEVVAESLARARALLGRYASDDVFGRMSSTHRAYAYLLRAGRPDLLSAFHTANARHTARISVPTVSWHDGLLVVDLQCRWQSNSDEPIVRRENGRLVRVVDSEVERALPREFLDVTADAKRLGLKVRMRNRRTFVGWDVPCTVRGRAFDESDPDDVRLTARGTATLDIDTGALGAALDDDVWDFHVRTTWLGLSSGGTLPYEGSPLPVARNGRGGVAYANNSKGLSLDLAQRLRTFVLDADPAVGPAGAIDDFSVPLQDVAVFGSSVIAADMLFAVPAGGVAEAPELDEQQRQDALATSAAAGALHARVIADGQGARLVGSAALSPGQYVLYTRIEGKLHRTKRTMTVDEQGAASFG